MTLISEIIQKLQAEPNFDFKDIRLQIHEAKKQASSPEEHVLIIETYEAILNNMERQLNNDALNQFRNVRKADYRLLLMMECLDGENVSPDKLDTVTRREVEAGRMSADDDLRSLASASANVMGKNTRKSWFSRLLKK